MKREILTGIVAGLALAGLAACGSGESPSGGEATPADADGSSDAPVAMADFPDNFPLPPASIATKVEAITDDAGDVVMVVGEFSSPMAQGEVENYFHNVLPDEGFVLDGDQMPMMLTFSGNGYQGSSVSFYDVEPFQAGSNFSVTLMTALQ